MVRAERRLVEEIETGTRKAIRPTGNFQQTARRECRVLRRTNPAFCLRGLMPVRGGTGRQISLLDCRARGAKDKSTSRALAASTSRRIPGLLSNFRSEKPNADYDAGFPRQRHISRWVPKATWRNQIEVYIGGHTTKRFGNFHGEALEAERMASHRFIAGRDR